MTNKNSNQKTSFFPIQLTLGAVDADEGGTSDGHLNYYHCIAFIVTIPICEDSLGKFAFQESI